MRTEIQQLEEAIAGVMSPIVSPQPKGDDEPEEGDALDERASPGPVVSMAQVNKLVDALVDGPKAMQVLSNILKKYGGEGPFPQGREETFKSHLRSFLKHSVPLALQDGGLKVQSAAVGKARRGMKAIGSGKGMAEVIELWEEPLSEDDSNSDDGAVLKEELARIL